MTILGDRHGPALHSALRAGGAEPPPTGGATRVRGLAAAFATALLAAALAATAHAQLDLTDPGEKTGQDTWLTPNARNAPEGVWQPLGGGRFGSNKVRSDSRTPFDADLYNLSFRNVKFGFFAGAQCRREDPDEPFDGQRLLDLRRAGEDCERVPVIYAFTDRDDEGPIIKESWRGEDASDPGGYVGAVAWLGDGRALAVGGDGEYVRREKLNPTTPENDPAGSARAWLYENGKWEEITGSERMRPGMRGMQALAATPSEGWVQRAEDAAYVNVDYLAYAGALGQRWRFEDGRFHDSPGADVGARLRGFAFSSHNYEFSSHNGDVGDSAFFWRLKTATGSLSGGESAYAVAHYRRVVGHRWNGNHGIYQAPWPYVPSFTAIGPDGPPRSEEQSPHVAIESGTWSYDQTNRTDETRPPAAIATRFRLASVEAGPLDSSGWSWTAVGSFPSGQAATLTRRPVGCTSARSQSAGCYQGLAQSGDAEYVREKELRSRLQTLDTYALNAIQTTPFSGSTWAVGDHGAILRQGEGGGLVTDEPQPPDLKAQDEAKLADSSPYASFRPKSAAEDVGGLPALVQRPLERFSEPRFVPGSAPELGEAVSALVMSRDGQQGWALTPFDGTLYRYDGAYWKVCDADGDPTHGIEPDPACAGVHPRIPAGGAVVRIPYENDDDPSNDDRFEVLAGGFRFADGKWEEGYGRYTLSYYDSGTAGFRSFEASSLAFATPDEGWAVQAGFGYVGVGSGTGTQVPTIVRFDGTQWIRCPQGGDFTQGGDLNPPRYKGDANFPTNKKCFDRNRRLPFWNTESNLANPQGVSVTVAGRRVYLYGSRAPEDTTGTAQAQGKRSPMAIYRDTDKPCKQSGDPGCWRADPGADTGWSADGTYPSDAVQGRLKALSVSRAPDGSYGGWATVDWEGYGRAFARMTPVWDEATHAWSSRFERFRERNGGPVKDYGLMPDGQSNGTAALLSLRQGGEERALALSAGGSVRLPLSFDPPQGRWTLLRNPFGSIHDGVYTPGIPGEAWGLVAPDEGDGFWLAATACCPGYDAEFAHYTRQARKPVFEDVAHPAREGISDIAGAEDGTLWVATARNVVYRYDRIGGFERIVLPNWEPGRLQTAGGSGVNAVAAGPDGSGIAVGDRGRIANLSRTGARLDRAAGRLCGAVAVAPCGTGRDLHSAAIAPDGSALVGGGKGAALLFRPADGEFRRIQRPPAPGTATLVGISFPTPERAYVASSEGQIYRGERTGEADWSWHAENLDAEGNLISRTSDGVVPLTSLVVAADGHGYATGRGGELYERTGSGSTAWVPVRPGYKLYTTAIARGQGEGAAFGGSNGLVVTRTADGRYDIARLPDETGTFKLELLPGLEPGQLEAWAASSDRLLHYDSDPGESLLRPQGRAEALPDTPAPRKGETVFAAFGKSDCSYNVHSPACPPMLTTNNTTGRIVEELVARSKRPGSPRFALFTGDVNDAANTEAVQGTLTFGPSGPSAPPTVSSVNHRRWRELVADYLTARGVPVFGAIGNQDFSATENCPSSQFAPCESSRAIADNPGLNYAWQLALSRAPAPWGVGAPASSGSIRFEPVPDPLATGAAENAKPKRPQGAEGGDDEGLAYEFLPQYLPDVCFGSGCLHRQYTQPYYSQVRDTTSSLLGLATIAGPSSFYDAIHTARTHYAFDVVDTHGGGERKRARVVVVDSSLRSLNAADPVQNPPEAKGGQTGWLEDVLCERGAVTSAGSECTRERAEPAIVLSNSPSYSYGPGQGAVKQDELEGRSVASPQGVVDPPDTQLDATTFETILMRHRTSVAVSGRIGWNGLYYATAPGVHEPCPGGSYPAEAPPPGARLCGRSAGEGTDPKQVTGPAAQGLSEALRGAGAPPPPQADDATGAAAGLTASLPFVVSSSAGGKLAGDGEAGAARNGYWRGYAIVRVDRSGDPQQTIVEQRPILDWVSATAAEHTLRPGQRMTLRGVGREPYAGGPRIRNRDDTPVHFRYIDIDSPAVTHRYDLVEADPERPWIPRRDADGAYVALDPSISTLDPQSGRIKAGKGNHPRAYALAILSVADHVATWPLVFEPRKSWSPKLPRVIRAPAVRPIVLSQPPEPPPPPAPSPPAGTSANVSAPSPAAPPPPAQSLEPPPITAPTPPVPPLPPGSAQSVPLNLAIEAPAVAVVPPPGVFPPPAPPVQPAPPSGARREARQRQAATQKSGAEGAPSEIQELGGDRAESPLSPKGAEMSRRDRVRPGPSFTAVSQGEQPSAWARGALYGGGVTVMALALALGWTTVRPTPRRRRPPVPAPAWTWSRRR